MKTALTISDSDSCGGTGVAADVKTFTMLNVFGMTAITSVTAQNTLGVQDRFNLEPELIIKQIDLSAGDLDVDACKTGVLPTVAIVDAVAEAIKRNKLAKYVCDPVLKTRKGEKVLADDALVAIAKKLVPLATIVTAGVDEAKALTGYTSTVVDTISAAKTIARKIIEMGAKAVVIKAVLTGDETVDLLLDGKEFTELAAKTQPEAKTYGSGAVFSAAITAALANSKTLVEAVDLAKNVVNMAIQYSDGQGRGNSFVNVLAYSAKKK